MTRSLSRSSFNTTAQHSTAQHSTALHCHNIVHESSQQCSAWRPAHLLALIPLSRDLNEEGVAFIGGLRAPEMPYSHFWDWGRDQHFTWFWATFKPHLWRNLYLLLLSPIIICPQMCKISTSLKFPSNKLCRAVQSTVVRKCLLCQSWK